MATAVMPNPQAAMQETYTLTTEEAEAIIILLGEVAVTPGGLEAQKNKLMSSLATLLEADSWAWAVAYQFKPKEVPLNSGFITGGFSPEEFAKYQEALEHPDTAILNAGLTEEFARKGTHLTRLREQVDAAGYFEKSAVHPIWMAAGVEQVIQSVRPRRDGAISHLGFYRRPGRQPFTAREARIAHIILSEVSWLHEAPTGSELGPAVVSLTPRLRMTLNLLLEGQSRAQIAMHLGLSPATLAGYVKEVFRQFHVHSQPELIARFRNGDGGDVAGG